MRKYFKKTIDDYLTHLNQESYSKEMIDEKYNIWMNNQMHTQMFVSPESSGPTECDWWTVCGE